MTKLLSTIYASAKHKIRKQTKMKKLIITACAVATMLGSAATYEENLELANTPIEKITAANVEAVCNAAVAVTNVWKVIQCRDKKLITFEQVEALLSNGNPAFGYDLANNAIASSNETICARTYSKLEELALASADHCYQASSPLSWLGYKCHYSKARLASAKKLVAAGKKIHAISVLFDYLPYTMILKGVANDEFDIEYVAYIKEIYPTLAEAWLTTEEDYAKIHPWQSGISICCYAIEQANLSRNFESLDAFAPKVVKFITALKDCNLWVMSRRKESFFKKCRDAAISSKINTIGFRLKAARLADEVEGDKKATLSVYPDIVDAKTRVETAIYLDDVDKLIDALKVVSDDLDAKTVESIIAPLNGVNAGYRADDLRLALSNVNKKYTIKLYDDRDTWEPILSKIRAMIDVL